jgi:hypothetical protein
MFFDNPVFQRMERNDAKSPSGKEESGSLPKKSFQVVQLVIDRDS